MGRRLGDAADPLLVSVRSGAPFSMPGMMDTVLNLGLNDEAVEGLAKQTADERFAYDSYRRFIALFGRIVLDADGPEFDELFDAAKSLAGSRRPTTRSRPSSCGTWCGATSSSPASRSRRTRERSSARPSRRCSGRGTAIAPSPTAPAEHIAHDSGTAVNVQAMVFGNRDDNSGTGVGFTRDPATGAQGSYGDFLVNAQGEDVVAGIRKTLPLSALEDRFPQVYRELHDIFARLERHYRDMLDTEFTIEQGKLWMLQTRVGKRTGRAALRMAVNMTVDPDIQLDAVPRPSCGSSRKASIRCCTRSSSPVRARF